jgi:hypothetical protein
MLDSSKLRISRSWKISGRLSFVLLCETIKPTASSNTLLLCLSDVIFSPFKNILQVGKNIIEVLSVKIEKDRQIVDLNGLFCAF